jgi:hypothetical protein
MKKSDEKVPDKIDYSKLPKELGAVIEPQNEEIIEESRITFDGRQYLVRFPTEISKLANITKDNKIRFTLKRPLPNTNTEPKLDIEII